jgi:F0F1-type ATP synthase membrane subunit b/b'
MSIFDQIFADEQNFKDDVEITIGDKKVKLGEIRDLTKSQQRMLADKLTEAKGLAEKASQVITDYEAKALELANKVTSGPARSTDDENWQEDPLFRPVAKALKGYEDRAKKAEENLEKITNALTNTAKIWFRDRSEMQFERGAERLKKNPKFKDYDVDKILDYATQNKIVDGNGLPSVSRAIQELTKVDDLEEARRRAYEEGLKAGQQKGRLATMTRPTSAGGPTPEVKDAAMAKHGLEGLGDDVAKDPELMQMLSDLGALDPNDIVQ